MRALEAIAVGAWCGPRASRSAGVRTPSGRWLAHLPSTEAEQLLGTAVYSFRRADLHHALREPLPSGCLITGAEAVTVTSDPAGPGWHIHTGLRVYTRACAS